MNEEALILAYNQAKATGYNGTQEDFQSLLMEDEKALDLAYNQAKATGFTGEADAFSDLLGLKKKGSDSDSSEEDSSSISGTVSSWAKEYNQRVEESKVLGVQQGATKFLNETGFDIAPYLDTFRTESGYIDKEFMDNLQQEEQEEIEKLKQTKGQARAITSPRMAGEIGGAIRPSFNIPADERYIREGVRKIKSQNQTKIMNQRVSNMRNQILNDLPEEVKNNKAKLSELSDYLYLNFGINADLDGDGIYNDMASKIGPDSPLWFAKGHLTMAEQAASLVSNAGNTLLDLTIDPALYYASTAVGTLVGAPRAFGEAYRAVSDPIQESMRSFETQVPDGMVGSIQKGNAWAAANAFTNGLGASIPSIGLGMYGGPVGIGILGVGSGTSAYMEAKDDPAFENDWQRFGWGVMNGVTDIAMARAMKWTASKVAVNALGKQGGEEVAKGLTKDYLKGIGFKYGVSMGSGAVEEGSVSAIQIFGKHLITGEAIPENWAEQIADAAILGAVIEQPAFTGQAAAKLKGVNPDLLDNMDIENPEQTSYAAANSQADADEAASDSKDIIKNLTEQLQTVTDENTAQNIKKQINTLEKAERTRRAKKTAFYNMMMMRHPEDFNTLRELDLKIAQASITYKGLTSDDARAKAKESINSLVEKRLELEAKHKGEDVSLNAQETKEFNEMRVASKLKSMKNELDQLNQSIEMEKQAEGTEYYDPEMIAEMEAAQEKLQKEFGSAIGLINQINSAIEDYESAQPTEFGQEMSIEDIQALEAELAENFGVDPQDISRVQTMTEAEAVAKEEQADRLRDDWMDSALEAAENSSLTEESLKEIFATDNFAMLTGENPNNTAVSEAENEANNKRVREYLDEAGFKYHEIKGRYDGKGENSFLVEGMTRSEAALFAKEFRQESVAHKDGLVLGDGSINLFEGGATFDQTATDFFSAIKDSEGNTVKFGFMPSDKYQDSKGEPIDESGYNDRINTEKVSFEDIEKAALESATEERTKPRYEVGEGVVVVPISKDGSPSLRAGTAGLKAGEVREMNNLIKLFTASYGPDVKVYIYETQDAARAIGEGDFWGGLFQPADLSIHINPQQVKENIKEESEAGFKRIKTLTETVMEEVGHAVIDPAFDKLDEKQQQSIINEIYELAKNDQDLIERMNAKKRVYSNMRGMTPDLLRAELFQEFISAAAGGEGVNLGLMDKVRVLINKVIMTAYGALGKQFTYKDPRDIHKVVAALDLARKKGQTFKADQILQAKRQRKTSELVSPAALTPNEDGKVVVRFRRPMYRNGKDIGNYEDRKTFNDKWHFVNWWKKATDMGAKDNYFDFQTVDGKPIDVDRIVSWETRKSDALVTELSSIVERYNDRIEEAQRKGVINKIVANKMKQKMAPATRKSKYIKEGSTYDYLLKMAQAFEEKSIDLINKVAEREGKSFNYSGEEAISKASQALKTELFDDKQRMKSFQEYGEILSELYYGANTQKARYTRFAIGSMFRDKYLGGESPKSIKNEETAVSKMGVDMFSKLYDKFYGTREQRIETFGEDPVDFYDNHNKAADEFLGEVRRFIELEGTPEEQRIAYNFIVGVSSIGKNAKENITGAEVVFSQSAEYRARGGEYYIDPRIIDDLRNRNTNGDDKSTSGLVLSALDGHTVHIIADKLEQVNKLAKTHERADGTVDWKAALNDINQFEDYIPQNVAARDGSEANRRYKAQEMFGPKIGAFILNMNGNESVPTIDSHVGYVVLGGLGYYIDPQTRLFENIEKVADEIGVSYTPGNETAVIKSLKEKIKTLRNERNPENIKKIGRLQRLCDAATIRDVKPGQRIEKRHRIMQRVVLGVAKNLGITPAQAGQIMFADSQIMNGGFDPTETRNYMTFARKAAEFRREPTPHWRRQSNAKSRMDALRSSVEEMEIALRFERESREINMLDKRTIDSPELEVRSSKQLKMAFDPVMQAENSHLYRKRNAQEALTVKEGLVITESVVNEALQGDAASRRVIAKNAEVNPGQKVGVRLNLNVFKNTGLPVQTMHDKTASGEALKYAPVVTVRNADLFVSQSARRKIFSFQENKFPMASVDGEFVSDNIADGNYDGVKAFFNPFKHNVFVDAEGRPIKSAEEATIVGNTVYLRGDIQYYDFNDPILREGRQETPEQRAKRIKRGPKYDKALKRFEAYSKRVLGVEYADRQDLEEAYDNMPFTSQVALDDSDIAEQAEEAQVRASGRLFLRRTAGRMANRYGEIRADIMSNPENYFSKQSIQKAKDNLEMMSDYDLIDIMTDDALGRLQNRNDDMSVLATAELIKRAVGRGDMGSVAGLISEAAKIGTSAGRLLRHFRELKQSTPEGIYTVVAKAIEERGNKMTNEQENKLRDISAELFRLQAEHEALVKRAIRGEDVEEELKRKTEEVKAAERLLDTFANSMIEKGWGSIGKMLIQGNLLTTMSQITNIGANMVNAIGKVGVDIIALPVERLVSKFGFDTPDRQYSIAAYMYGMKRFGDGVVEAIDEIMTGQTDDVTEWRVNRGFAPFRSFMAAIGKGDLPITQEGNSIPVSQRMKLMVQGTFGIPAEVMFRLLSLGDTPFRRMVEGIELYQAGMAQGLEGDALKQFVKHPTKADRMKAEEEGRKLTFQEPTVASRAAEDLVMLLEKVSSGLFNWIPGVDGRAASSFLIRSTVPYVRTPANILYDTLTFVTPYVAIPRMMNDLAKGDARGASQNFAKLMIGSMVGQTTALLIKEGLISGALDWEDDEEKNIAYDQFPPSSINVTGLQRMLNGEDPAHQPDDYFIGYNKLGVAGAIMGAIIKGIDKEEIRNRDYSGTGYVTHTIQDAFGVGAFSSIAHMMDQSFLQGVNGLVNVMASSDADDFQRNFERWFGTAFQAVSATALPNQLSAMYRADREYLPDVRLTKDMDTMERLAKRMEFTIRDRTFNLDGLPVRTDWKGNPIKQTPRGTGGYRYQLLDITKARQGEADPVSNEIYRLYEQTENLTKAVGTPSFAEKRAYNVPDVKRKDLGRIRRLGVQYDWMNDEEFMKERVFLNTEQLNRMMAAAGKQRYAEIQEYMGTPAYQALTDEERVEALNKINDDYRSGIQKDGRGYKNHTIELFKILQEIYDARQQD